MTIVCKEEQPLNAQSPILVTLSGMTIVCKEEQPLNALSPILVTHSGITIDCKREQSSNIRASITVTLSGMRIGFKTSPVYITLYYLLLLYSYCCKSMNFSQFQVHNQGKSGEHTFNLHYPYSQTSLHSSPLRSLHSLSFLLSCNHSKLTIFKVFNFVAYEKSDNSHGFEIFRVFDGLIINCISVVCKCVEERLKKDGVLMVEKRRLFSRKRRVSGAETSFFESKDFVFFRKNGIFCP